MHYQWQGEHLLLKCHVQPNATTDEIVGLYNPGPEQRLKIRLKAPALEGKANRHLVKIIAQWFAVPNRQVKIVQGESSRLKTLLIENPRNLPERSAID